MAVSVPVQVPVRIRDLVSPHCPLRAKVALGPDHFLSTDTDTGTDTSSGTSFDSASTLAYSGGPIEMGAYWFRLRV